MLIRSLLSFIFFFFVFLSFGQKTAIWFYPNKGQWNNEVLYKTPLGIGDFFIDKQGFLTIIGRAKEMIVTSGGKNVWPEPIENLLNNDRFISQAIIIGNNRKFISALIIPDWQEIEIYFKKNNLGVFYVA